MDSRLKEIPALPKGAVPHPLACRGRGHDPQGYPCFNHSDPRCLGFVCRTCAAKQKAKPCCELCNLCQLAVERGGSMDQALATIAELHPMALENGKVTCASFDPKAKPCRKCVRHICGHCDRPFRSHHNRTAHCGDICKAAARRETQRRADEKRRQRRLSAAA